jgi:hypothetical protein
LILLKLTLSFKKNIDLNLPISDSKAERRASVSLSLIGYKTSSFGFKTVSSFDMLCSGTTRNA